MILLPAANVPQESSSAPSNVRLMSSTPVKTPTIVSKSLVQRSIVAGSLVVGVQLYQTDAPPGAPDGSPGSIVASTLVPVVVTGSGPLLRASAFAKSSLAGGAAAAGEGAIRRITTVAAHAVVALTRSRRPSPLTAAPPAS